MRCWSGVHTACGWVPVLRRSAEEALHRARDTDRSRLETLLELSDRALSRFYRLIFLTRGATLRPENTGGRRDRSSVGHGFSGGRCGGPSGARFDVGGGVEGHGGGALFAGRRPRAERNRRRSLSRRRGRSALDL